MFYKYLLRPVFFRMDPEKAHDFTYNMARWIAGNKAIREAAATLLRYEYPLLKQQFWGLTFDNPVGLAAGFDKNGYLPHALHATGFGFTETGSITANSSKGNPRPRMFRLAGDKAVINRMGLNNDGASRIMQRLRESGPFPIPMGVNIAKTHDPAILGDLAIEDYLISLRYARELADYLTINISCPNTEEGKTFEDPETLVPLLRAIRAEMPHKQGNPPLLIKLSADLDSIRLSELLDCCEPFDIQGYVCVNTSAKRENLYNSTESALAQIGKGGLSGRPLLSKSIRIVTEVRKHTKGLVPVIGVGGISTFEDALAMFKAGASLIQVYTGLVYEGPGLVSSINYGLQQYLEENGLKSLSEVFEG